MKEEEITSPDDQVKGYRSVLLNLYGLRWPDRRGLSKAGPIGGRGVELSLGLPRFDSSPPQAAIRRPVSSLFTAGAASVAASSRHRAMPPINPLRFETIVTLGGSKETSTSRELPPPM